MELSKYFGSVFLDNDEEKIELETDIQGVSNGFLSEILCAITGYDIEVCGKVEELVMKYVLIAIGKTMELRI